MVFSRTRDKLCVRAQLFLLGLAIAVGFAPAAMAHPDYWVTVKYQFSFSENAVTELGLEWKFDVFYSSQAFNRYDLDRDGAFSNEEADALRVAIFEPFAEDDYFVKVVSGEALQPMTLRSVVPSKEGDHLVIAFALSPENPLNYREMPLVVATHDEGAYDFTLSETDFLKVQGTYDPTCRFRIEDGTGPLNGISQTVALLCAE